MLKKLLAAARHNDSWLCVGLDPQPTLLPRPLARASQAEAIWEFNRQIIEATSELVCAYKPNIAFYEALGPRGLEILQRTREHIPAHLPVICDAKRGDVAHTNKAYAQALFSLYNFDAVTVNPYLGFEALEPWLSYPDKGLFLLCRTSNPGAGQFQDLNCVGRPLYTQIATAAARWDQSWSGRLGLVVGATYPTELATVRQIVGEAMPLLLPGVGAQGGDLVQAVQAGMNEAGELALISVSRSVIYASAGADFASAARAAAQQLRNQINRARRRD